MSTQFYDTQVSTVDYQILFTKREREAILDSGRVIVTSAMSGSGFASWQISLFTQEKLNKDGIEKPENWPAEEAEKWAERYVPAPGSPPDSQKAKIIGLKPEYLKYLQVDYQVISSFDRKPPRPDEDQVGALREIADAIRKKT